MTGQDDDPTARYEAHYAANLGKEAALRALHEAEQRQTRRSKLRLLEVVCVNQYRLLEVFHTGSGPLVIARQRRFIAAPDAPLYGPHRSVTRGRVVEVMLAGLTDSQEITAQCFCKMEARVPIGWLRAQLATGGRRVVWPEAHGPRYPASDA